MNAKKLKGRFVCFSVLVAMIVTLLPTMAFAESEKKIHLNYSAVNEYEAGGTYIIGGGTPIAIADGWDSIDPDGEDVVFNLTPPNDSYPVAAQDKVLHVLMNGTDITSRISNNSITIFQSDFQSEYAENEIWLSIYWSQAEKDFNELNPNSAGLFPFSISLDEITCTASNSQTLRFGNRQTVIATPDADGIVTLTLNDTPKTLIFEHGSAPINLILQPVVTDHDETMIEYSEADKTITFHTKVGMLKDCISGQYGAVDNGWASLTILKSGQGPGPGPGPGPQGPRAEFRGQINDNSGAEIVFDPNDNTPYIKYNIPLDILVFYEIPTDDEGHTTQGFYDELINQGFEIKYTWPEQEDKDHKLEKYENVQSEITVSKPGLTTLNLTAGSNIFYDGGELNITKFEVAEPVKVTENYDGVAVSDESGQQYFKYNYQDKVKFNIEYTLSYHEGDNIITNSYQYTEITIDQIKQYPGIGQRTVLMADMQETEHWEAGKNYDAYFALNGTIIKGEVQVEESDKEITYWEELADAAVDEIAANKELTLNSIQPENAADAASIFEQVFSLPNNEKYQNQHLSFELVPDANDMSKGTINVYRTYESTVPGVYTPELIKSYENVDIEYLYDEEIAAEAENCKADFKTFNYNQTNPFLPYYGNVYLVTDLDMINLELNGGDTGILNRLQNTNNLINFSSEFLDSINRLNFETQLYISDYQKWEGRGHALSYGCGKLLLSYDDTVYGVVDNVGYILVNVIYIPSDTPKTVEAFTKAAGDRIEEFTNRAASEYEIKEDDHYGSPSGSIRPAMDGHNLDAARIGQLFADVIGMESLDDDVTKYTIDTGFSMTINGLHLPLWIVADSEKMLDQTSAYMKTVDLRTKASVSTSNDGTLPLDAKIAATEHIDDAVYEEQMEKIGLDEGVVFDIDLNSAMREGKVQYTEIENGFEVRIPVPETYAGQTVYAYYTPEEGGVEVHDAIVEKGENGQYFAVFYTNHFSTYTIGTKAAQSDWIVAMKSRRQRKATATRLE